MAEADDLLLEEWLGVLAEVWTAAGKPLEADRLKVYRQLLGEVPLALLELAVRRVIRENVYHVVPLPGLVWAASSATRPTGMLREELGEPWLTTASLPRRAGQARLAYLSKR